MKCGFVSHTLLVVLLLGLTLAGCGRDEEPEPTATSTVAVATHTPIPTSAPLPTETPIPAVSPTESVAVETNLEGPIFDIPSNILTSYRTRGALVLTTLLNGDGTERESLQLEGAYVAIDGEFKFNQFFVLDALQAGSTVTETVAIYQVDDVVAAYFDGEWRTAGRRDAGISLGDNPFNQPLTALTNPPGEATEIGSETLAGIETTHYQITDPAFFVQIAKINMAEGQTIENVQIDIWVATAEKYIVKYVISATVNDALDFDAEGNPLRADQQVAWDFELYDIGADVVIEIPAEAPDPQAFTPPGFTEGSFPLPAGAMVRVNPFGQTEIITDLSQDEVVSFYTKILSQLGWKLEGAFGLYEATKDDLAFGLVTLENAQGGTRVRLQSP